MIAATSHPKQKFQVTPLLKMMSRFALLVTILGLFFPAHADAQDIRAEIQGKVVDPTGAVIPGAKVTVTEVNTGVVTTTVSNKTGDFALPFITAGRYTVQVEMQGFKKYEQSALTVEVSDNVNLPITMQTGDVNSEVTVNAETQTLRTADADLGTVINSRQLEDLPVKDNNPLLMASLSAGVLDFATTSSGGQTQTFTSSTPSSISIDGIPYNGANGGNDYRLDGAPNVAGNQSSTGQNQAFSPTASMVQQFKIQTATYDAGSGFGPGASISLSLRSGTNLLHGTIQETNQNRVFNANEYFTAAAGLPKQDNRQNDYSAIVTGPIVLPKIYNGHDRTFFMVGYQGVHSSFPKSTNALYSVPTAAERTGDFSALLPLGCTSTNGQYTVNASNGIAYCGGNQSTPDTYQLYNPYSAVASGGHVTRKTGFANNIIPFGQTINGHALALDPFANYIFNTHFPLPNFPGKSDGENNYITQRYQVNVYNAIVARLDHKLSDRQNIFAHFYYSHLNEQEQISFNNGLGDFFYRDNRGVDLDHVFLLSPNLTLNTRVSASRYSQLTIGVTQGENLAKAGLSANYISQINAIDPGHARLPDVAVQNLPALSTTGYTNLPSTIWSAASEATYLRGKHLLRIGGEFRLFLDNGENPGNDSGTLQYNANYLEASDTSSSFYGGGIASFELGILTGGSIQTAGSYAEADKIISGYVQDSWRATSRLTMNVGLRYEGQFAATERYNRAVTQFDFHSTNPLQTKAQAAYVSSGSPLLPATLPVIGGPLFAGVSGSRSFWNANLLEGVQPRIGIAYTLNPTMVLRGGYGVYGIITRIDAIQTGFSQTTGLTSTPDNGVTFIDSSEDPFPATASNPNPILQPTGSSAGLATGAGTSITTVTNNLRRPYTQRWSLGIEQSLGNRTMMDISYVGNRGTKLFVSRNYDSIPAQYLSTSPTRDATTISNLSKKVPNPFYGLIPGQSLGTSTTIAVSQLLLPYPEFTGVTALENTGFSWYHSLQVNLRHQFSDGLHFGTAFTWSKSMQATSYRNATDPRPERLISDQDRVLRFVTNGIYELPFGRTKRFMANVHGFSDKLVSGWQVQSTYQIQAGAPLGFGNAIVTGDIHRVPLDSGKKSIAEWFDVSQFDNNSADQLSNNIQILPSRFSFIRGPRSNLLNVGLQKNTRLYAERANFQLRVDAINALNHTNFSNPSTGVGSSTFGQVTGTNSTPRVLQLTGKIVF